MSEIPYTYIIMAINVIAFFITQSDTRMMNKLIMWPYFVKREKEIHRLLTSGFLHADMLHLFFNMFTLFFFGTHLEYIFSEIAIEAGQFPAYGKIAYLVLYLSAIIFSDLPCYFKYKDTYEYRSLGASGAVSAVVYATILFNPWSSIYLYGAVKISATLYAVLFIWYCIYMSKKGNDNINHDAHLWGAVYGLVLTMVAVFIISPDIFKSILYELQKPGNFPSFRDFFKPILFGTD
jgi:membrane associated rhomboid family serine protease